MSGLSRLAQRPALTASALGVFAVGFVAFRSWSVSFWYDEAATVSAANRSVSDLAKLVKNVDAVHGLYYLLTHWWVALTDISQFWLRFPSALAIGAGVAGTYLLARRLTDANTALLAALLLLVLPRVAWAGIEARSSALTLAVAVWLVLVFLRAVEKPTFARWAGFAGFLAAGIWLNIFLALLIGAFATTLWLLGAKRQTWLPWLAATAAAVVLGAPVVLATKSQSAQLGGVELPLATMLRNFVINQWFLGGTPAPGADGGGSSSGLSAHDLTTTSWLAAAVVLAGLGWLLVAGAIWPRRDGSSRWPDRAVAVTLPWLLVPSIVAIGYSLTISPLYHQRYFVFSAPALAILMAIGLRRLPGRPIRLIVVLTMVTASLVVYVSQRGETAKSGYAWNQVAELINEQAKPADGVYFVARKPPTGSTADKTTRLLALAYPTGFAGLRDLTLRASPLEAANLSGVSNLLQNSTAELASVDRIWVISWDDYPPVASEKEAALLRATGFELARDWRKSNSVVSLYLRH